MHASTGTRVTAAVAYRALVHASNGTGAVVDELSVCEVLQTAMEEVCGQLPGADALPDGFFEDLDCFLTDVAFDIWPHVVPRGITHQGFEVAGVGS